MFSKTLFSLHIKPTSSWGSLTAFYWAGREGSSSVSHTYTDTLEDMHSVKAYKSFLLCSSHMWPVIGWVGACLHLYACLCFISRGWSYMRWPIFGTHTKRESWAHKVGLSSETQFHSEERELKEKQQERDSQSILASEEICVSSLKKKKIHC